MGGHEKHKAHACMLYMLLACGFTFALIGHTIMGLQALGGPQRPRPLYEFRKQVGPYMNQKG